MLAATTLELAPLARLLGLELGALRSGRGEWPATHRVHWPRPAPTSRPGAASDRRGGARDLAVTFVVSGVGKANAAAALAATATRLPNPPTVVQLGIGGAYPDSGLSLGGAAVAASERDLDLGVGDDRSRAGLEAIGIELIPGLGAGNRIELATPLARAVVAATGAPLLDFATSDGVTASPAVARYTAERHSVAIESMEGFAAAQVCLALGLEFVEVRGVSNRVGERDKAAWRISEAAAAAAAAAHATLGLL